MKISHLLNVAGWAHRSWFANASPPRTERAKARAAQDVFARFPALIDPGATDLPWFIGRLPRPACARLMRICAALACARALRLVVCSPARSQFSIGTGLPPLTALQSHPRGENFDLLRDEPVDFFNRRSLTVAGLALALRAMSSEGQRQWMQLHFPRELADAAARWRLADVSPEAAFELIGDALRVLDAGRMPC